MEERPGAHNGLFSSPTLMPLGEGVENYLITSISSYTSFTPTIPWCQDGTWHQFSFRLRAAPELYGSSELGVRGYSCIGVLAGAQKKIQIIPENSNKKVFTFQLIICHSHLNSTRWFSSHSYFTQEKSPKDKFWQMFLLFPIFLMAINYNFSGKGNFSN